MKLALPNKLKTPLALAVSGGPDSMAMAWLAKEHFGAEKLHAFIVDHALREESAREAAQVKTNLLAMGIQADILRWDHDKITSRIHVKARHARYDLLCAACKKHGINKILLAHHKNDQAETILMRLAKGSGLRGLAGMQKETIKNGVHLLRPLLHATKEELIEICQANQIPFVTDQSNESEKYARGRLRRVHDALETEGFTTERLLDLGLRAGDAAEALHFYAKTYLRLHAVPTFGGTLRLNREAFHDLPRAVALETFSMILQAMHPKPYPPRRTALITLLEATDTASLQGCLIQRTQDHIIILREPSAVSECLPIVPHETKLWDGRWHVSYEGDEKGLEIRALGQQPKSLLKDLAPAILSQVPQGRVRATLPALWKDKKLHGMPDFSFNSDSLFK